MLRDHIGNPVYVKLKDKSEYIGTLKMTDNTMNIVLEDCVEVRNGGKEIVAKYGTVFVRGSMILYVSFNPEKAAPDYTGA
ncbi:U6 snRNA-associated Sm-like protein LSm6 [Stetteria hydrogenophila]